MIVSAVYYDGEKKKYFVKRFSPEKNQRPEVFISQNKGSFMAFVSVDFLPMIHVSYAKEKGVVVADDEEVNISEFISIKGIKAQGNQLSANKIKEIKALPSLPYEEPEEEEEDEEEIEENDDINDDTDLSQDDFSENTDTDNSSQYTEEETYQEKNEGTVNDDGQVSMF